MQPYYYARNNRPKKSSALLPFVSLIVIVLIGVLVFQIFSYFSEKRRQALENKAAIEVVSGRAQMKIWGVDEWSDAMTGAVLHEGDSIRTEPGSRVVLTLLNGSAVRLSSETLVELTDLKTRDGQDELGLNVSAGDVWVKASENQAVNSSFTVSTEHLEVTSLGNTFAVSAGAREAVHVIAGTVQAIIRVTEPDDKETVRIADTLNVQFGQEISIGQEEIRQIQNRRPVQLLALLSDAFRDTEWYKFNRLQDSTQINNGAILDALANGSNGLNGLSSTSTELTGDSTSTSSSVDEVSEVFASPQILAPSADARTTSTGTVTISGTVSTKTKKLEVTTFIAGRPEPYILQKYKAGSAQWSYAVSPEYANIVAGDNRYSFVAIDADGNRSEAAELVIHFDKPKVTADLSAPAVSTFNGSTSSVTTETSVLISGTVGKGIVKVFVNDFALSRYVPDSGVWSYYTKKEYGNLNPGVNQFTVYGIDQDGRKTPLTQFTITRNEPEVSVPTTETLAL